MYCPNCGVEFRAGFTECSDCRVPLVDGKPRGGEENDTGDPGLDLVTVLEGKDPLLLAAAEAILQEADISFYMQGEEGARYGPVTPSAQPWCRIQVAADREAEARELLQGIQEVDPSVPVED